MTMNDSNTTLLDYINCCDVTPEYTNFNMYINNKNFNEKLMREIKEAKVPFLFHQEDKVNPTYYHGTKTADYIAEFNLDFDLGNAIKYISRAGNKPNDLSLDDLKKAKWYIDHAINLRENALK